MDLSGVRLVYATAQPVTRIEGDGGPVYVFHAQDGIAPEFSIDGDGVAGITAQSGRVARDAATGRYRVSQVVAGADIDIKTSKGGTVRLLVLSAEQADRLSIVDFAGRTRLVLTDAQLASTADGLVLSSIGEPRIRFSIFPALAAPPSGSLPLKASGRDGPFEVFEAQAPQRNVAVSFAQTRDAQPVPPLAMTGPHNTAVEPTPETFGKSAAWTIRVPAGALDGANDVFLRINARGDVARLFSGTAMLDDHFLDGRVWEIGLKRFGKEIATPLTLTVLPMRRDAPIYLDAGVANMVSGDETAQLVEVSAVPQYTLHLRAEGSKKQPAHRAR